MSRRQHHRNQQHHSTSITSWRREPPRNRSPPPSSFSKRDFANHTVVRQVRQITCGADHAELEKHYSFLPSSTKKDQTWQDRMVQHYHSHLYKEYVLADLTRPGQVGMRWRTKIEVQRGKGQLTCGNKHCPSHLQNERKQASTTEDDDDESLLLRKYYLLSSKENEPTEEESEELVLLKDLSYGSGLHDYEVPFTYQEHGKSKTELVKLRLCLRCAPLLFRKNGDSVTNNCAALKARQARYKLDHHNSSSSDAEAAAPLQDDSKRSCSSSSTESDQVERRRQHRKRKRRDERRNHRLK